jgi:hypothetical protein
MHAPEKATHAASNSVVSAICPNCFVRIALSLIQFLGPNRLKIKSPKAFVACISGNAARSTNVPDADPPLQEMAGRF